MAFTNSKSIMSNRRNRVANLFDVGDFWCKALRDLRNHFLYQRLVLHRLAGLHDTVTIYQTKKAKKSILKTYRTMVAWMTYLRSSSTVFSTSEDSALTSALIGKLRLTRIFFDLKSGGEKGSIRVKYYSKYSQRTRVQIILFRLLIDKDLRLNQ
jgi:hypothetical protein